MNTDVAIVTLSRFPDIFASLDASVREFESARRRIVVSSTGVSGEGWEAVDGIEPFNFARNANIGIAAAGACDVLLVNDDVELVEPIITQLQNGAELLGCSIMSPQVIGDGIGNQLAQASTYLHVPQAISQHYIPFVCVYLPRAVLDSLGPLREDFSGYGGEDVEYCVRAWQHGMKLGVSRARIKHGHGDCTYSSSFLRVMSDAERNRDAINNMRKAGV